MAMKIFLRAALGRLATRRAAVAALALSHSGASSPLARLAAIFALVKAALAATAAAHSLLWILSGCN